MSRVHGKSNAVPTLPCACASLRRAARAVTMAYDLALQRAGLTVTQFTILHLLESTGAIRHGKIGELLSMDSTTLTRTLGLLRKAGWIRIVAGKDRRERYVELASKGRQMLAKATPLWREAQGKLWTRLGDDNWRSLGALLKGVTSAALSG